jgi:DNA-binding beta-propeller fold protein YncE
LKAGFVLVGSLPTTDGTCHTIGQTSLLIIDRRGNLVATLTDPNLLDGPWDLTVNDVGNRAQVFVSNVLNGTVTRINLKTTHSGEIAVESMTRIASGYGFACNSAAVVVGPTGLAYDRSKDILYVASTSDNEIFAVPGAAHADSDLGTGTVIYQDSGHLFGPLALALAPNGDLITANGDAINNPGPSQVSMIVEFTPSGQFVSEFQVDPVPGSAFGLAVERRLGKILFAAVDDNTSFLNEWSE